MKGNQPYGQLDPPAVVSILFLQGGDPLSMLSAVVSRCSIHRWSPTATCRKHMAVLSTTSTLPELEPFEVIVNIFEPKVLLALQLLENNPTSGHVILCGDPYRLGPVICSLLSKHFEYNISLLEHLIWFSDSDAMPLILWCTLS
ncbi:hypothetical protein BC936DRAFT_149659 [Jimgerdemannia flammicorona]|uniref:Uncharacterized protein n=1 Tax=Jimgerdemannia flammicorona TaxID=994334 RepID=A0A433D0E2_9FUNG|nr:hypothetical protein BC936DRAFT_149659 [Jimgerdemannia flammicorona]